MPFLRQPQRFRLATRGPSNAEEAMAFQRPQAMPDIAFVPPPRGHPLGVPARAHPVRPLVGSRPPAQHVVLQVR